MPAFPESGRCHDSALTSANLSPRPGTQRIMRNGDSHIGIKELRHRLFSWSSAITLLIGALIIFLLMRQFLDFEWDEFANNLSRLNLRLFALAAVCYYVSFWFRGIRWRSITINAISMSGGDTGTTPGVFTLAGLILAGWFLNSVMFFRLGDAYRAWAVADRSSLNFGGGLGTVFAERVQDTSIVLVLVVIAGVWALIVDGFAASGPLVDAAVGVAIFSAGFVVILVVLLVTMQALGDRITKLAPSRIRVDYSSFQAATLDSLKRPQLPWQFLLGVIGWACEVGRFYFVAQALGLDMALSIAMFAALANAILSTAPIPGGFGLVETGLIGILLLTGLNDTDAFTLTVLDRAISWVSIVIFGSVPFVYYAIKRPRNGVGPADKLTASAPPADDWRP